MQSPAYPPHIKPRASAKGFELWYQPVFSSNTGEVVHNEVLLRWRSSQGHLYYPRHFMPWVTKAKMRQGLDRFVLRQALLKARTSPQAHLSINLSKASLKNHKFIDFISAEFYKSQVKPQSIKFEISELHAAQNLSRAIELTKQIQDLGCSVVLDNFSNDYLTFTEWEQLGVNSVKINGRFISKDLSAQEQFLLTKAITDTSVQMGQEAIAKSIGELENPKLLEECNFDAAQGFQLKPPSRKLSLTSTVDILGMSVDNWKRKEFIDQLDSGIVFTPNVDHLMQFRRDEEYRKAYGIADYKLCNSQFLWFASRVLGDPIQEKISSSDVLLSFCEEHHSTRNLKLFILGEEDIPAVAAAKMNQRFTSECVVGHHAASSHFMDNELECERVIRSIAQSGANTLVLGLPSPTQEKWVYRYQERLIGINLIFALGHGLAIESGVIPRPPQSFSNCGAEWIHDLFHNPQHLWKKYLVDDVPFLWLLVKEKVFH